MERGNYNEGLRKDCMKSIRGLVNSGYDHGDEELETLLTSLHEKMEKTNRKVKKVFNGGKS